MLSAIVFAIKLQKSTSSLVGSFLKGHVRRSLSSIVCKMVSVKLEKTTSGLYFDNFRE